MSYIKTKNGKIFNIKGISAENPIVAQSDNLVDFCEVYCVKNSIFPNFEDAKKYKKSLKKEESDLKTEYPIYGAIWTKWGIKYIAKSDKDGVLDTL